MPFLLRSTDYADVRALFHGTYLKLVIDSVIAGNSVGSLWVDAPAQPQSALLWDNGACFYLVGRADNPTFNGRLAQLFSTDLAPRARARGIDVLRILYSSAEWESHLDVVFPTLPLTRRPRVVYSLGGLKFPDWRSKLPTGFQIRPIDQILLADATLGNLPDLTQKIKNYWSSQTHFLQQGFGFCLVGDGQIICRCTAEYVSLGKCAIGIATAAPYRQQGFATLTASAFIESCLVRQIVPYWDAWQRNTASAATAEKIGLRKVQDYTIHDGLLSVA
jgi:RimJ/RimL family protein N-acetyltransferase